MDLALWRDAAIASLKDLNDDDVRVMSLGGLRTTVCGSLGLAAGALDEWRDEFSALAQKVVAERLKDDGAGQGGGDDSSTVGGATPKRQYLGTWSHTDDPTKKSPRDMSKKDFGELIVSLSDDVFRRSAANQKRCRLNRLLKTGVWEEKHTNGQIHYHFPVLAENGWYFAQLAKALRDKGIYADFSSEHDYYWTTVLYLCVPSAMPNGKKFDDIDSAPWLSPGHPHIVALLEDMPRGARASDKSRVRRFLGMEAKLTRSSKDVSLTDAEFAAHVVDKKLHSLTAVLAWVKEHVDVKSLLPVTVRSIAIGLDSYCFKHQKDLSARIAFAWERHGAPKAICPR